MAKHLQDKINEVLQDEVSEKVKEVQSEAVEDTVYNVYSPRTYQRREDEGGLSDMRNMRTHLVDDGVIEIENRTMANPHTTGGLSRNTGRYVSPIVVSGKGYEYPFSYNGVGRDFIQATKDELESSGVHVDALKKGLAKRGVPVK